MTFLVFVFGFPVETLIFLAFTNSTSSSSSSLSLLLLFTSFAFALASFSSGLSVLLCFSFPSSVGANFAPDGFPSCLPLPASFVFVFVFPPFGAPFCLPLPLSSVSVLSCFLLAGGASFCLPFSRATFLFTRCRGDLRRIMSCSPDPSLTSSSTCAGGGAMDPCQHFVVKQHKQQVNDKIYKIMFLRGFMHKTVPPVAVPPHSNTHCLAF